MRQNLINIWQMSWQTDNLNHNLTIRSTENSISLNSFKFQKFLWEYFFHLCPVGAQKWHEGVGWSIENFFSKSCSTTSKTSRQYQGIFWATSQSTLKVLPLSVLMVYGAIFCRNFILITYQFESTELWKKSLIGSM